MKGVFSGCGGTWKRCLIHDLECFSGLIYKNYFESGVICMTDIQFHVKNEESFKFYQKQYVKAIFKLALLCDILTFSSHIRHLS